jgi:predicted DNA binding CopG/RHH family protein
MAKKSKKAKDPLAGDLSPLMEKGQWVRFEELFEMQPKNKTITLRLSEDLLNEVKKMAKKKETNYQKLIREALIHLISKDAS